ELLQIDDSMPEAGGAGLQIQTPHPDKRLAEAERADFAQARLKTLRPARQREGVMAAEAFGIDQMKIIVGQERHDFPPGRDIVPGKNVAADVGARRRLAD